MLPSAPVALSPPHGGVPLSPGPYALLAALTVFSFAGKRSQGGVGCQGTSSPSQRAVKLTPHHPVQVVCRFRPMNFKEKEDGSENPFLVTSDSVRDITKVKLVRHPFCGCFVCADVCCLGVIQDLYYSRFDTVL